MGKRRFQPIAANLREKRRAGEPEQLGRLPAIPTGIAKHRGDLPALDGLERLRDGVAVSEWSRKRCRSSSGSDMSSTITLGPAGPSTAAAALPRPSMEIGIPDGRNTSATCPARAESALMTSTDPDPLPAISHLAFQLDSPGFLSTRPAWERFLFHSPKSPPHCAQVASQLLVT